MSNSFEELPKEETAEDNKVETLDANFNGVPGLTEVEKFNQVRIDGDSIRLEVMPLNDLGKIILSAKEKMTKNSEHETADELAKHLGDLTPQQIIDAAKREMLHTQEELKEMPGFITFLEKHKNELQEIAVDTSMSFQDGRTMDVEDYFSGKGVPTGAEHYFLTTIRDRSELTALLAVDGLNAENYTVRYFYSSNFGGGPKRELGFQTLKDGKPDMVFIFAEDTSQQNAEKDNHDKKDSETPAPIVEEPKEELDKAA